MAAIQKSELLNAVSQHSPTKDTPAQRLVRRGRRAQAIGQLTLKKGRKQCNK